MFVYGIQVCVYVISKVKSMGNFFFEFLTVEIWNLNLKKWPLENQKNNGSIEKKFARQIFRSVYVGYDPVYRINFYRAVNENYVLENWFFTHFNPKTMIFIDFLHL